MYIANQNGAFPGRSVYVLYQDRTDDNQLSANSILNSSISENVSLTAGANFRKLRSHCTPKLVRFIRRFNTS